MTTKIVGITGVKGGIGQALALEFTRANYQVVGLDLSPEPLPGTEYFQLDVTDEAASMMTYQQIQERFPDISIWVNNAGIAHLGPFLDVPAEKFSAVMAVNFNAVVTATRFWLKVFEQSGGTVVNMASAAGLIPNGDMSSYVASKHAVVGFTRAVQMELDFKRSLASTTLVTPGFVQTDIMQVGSEYGLPKELQRFATTPAECAQEIVRGVLKGEREIIPTMSGKLMTGLYRFLPFGQALAGQVYRQSRQMKK